MTYDEFDVLVNDIDELELERIGRTNEVPNLSAGVFTSFPVNGRIMERNLRFMVPLVCQLAGEPSKPSVNVWFLVNTGSPFTCLTMKSMKAILGANKEIKEHYRFNIAIQDQNICVEGRISKSNFKEVNILGTDALIHLKIQSVGQINWYKSTFCLSRE